MANPRWMGGAAAVAQVQTDTFGGTWEANDLIRATIGSRTYDFVAGSTTTATVVTNLVALWNALSSSLYPEFAELTASASTNDFVLTADTAGVPFTVTLTPLETGGGAADANTINAGLVATTGTATTANSGPKVWSVAANWSTGAVPITGDNVYFEDSDNDCLYGLAQSGVTLASLNFAATFTGTLGLPEENATGYDEYRDTYLAIGATVLDIGRGAGSGSGRIKINLGSAQSTVTIHSTGSGSDDLPAVLIKGTHVSNSMRANAGSVGIAILGGETATFATLHVSNATVRSGPGVTLTTVRHTGSGALQLESAATTIHKDPNSGTLTILGTGAYTTINHFGGTLSYQSTGTITTLNFSGALDLQTNAAARTITTTNAYKGAVLNDRGKSAAYTTGIALVGCELSEVQLHLGVNRTITLAA